MKGKEGKIGDLTGKFGAVAPSGVHREQPFTSCWLSLFPAAKTTLKEAKNTLNTFQILFSHVSNWFKLPQRCCPLARRKRVYKKLYSMKSFVLYTMQPKIWGSLKRHYFSYKYFQQFPSFSKAI